MPPPSPSRLAARVLHSRGAARRLPGGVRCVAMTSSAASARRGDRRPLDSPAEQTSRRLSRAACDGTARATNAAPPGRLPSRRSRHGRRPCSRRPRRGTTSGNRAVAAMPRVLSGRRSQESALDPPATSEGNTPPVSPAPASRKRATARFEWAPGACGRPSCRRSGSSGWRRRDRCPHSMLGGPLRDARRGAPRARSRDGSQAPGWNRAPTRRTPVRALSGT